MTVLFYTSGCAILNMSDLLSLLWLLPAPGEPLPSSGLSVSLCSTSSLDGVGGSPGLANTTFHLKAPRSLLTRSRSTSYHFLFHCQSLHRCTSDLTPSPGTSICHRFGYKKKKKERKEGREGEARIQETFRCLCVRCLQDHPQAPWFI